MTPVTILQNILKMIDQIVPYLPSLELANIGFTGPCIYAYCHTPKHLIKKKGEVYLRTDGNPFGTFFAGKDWNSIPKGPNKNNIICSAPLWQQAFDFLSDRYGFDSNITSDETGRYFYVFERAEPITGGYYNDRTEAKSACLDRIISYIKKGI